MNVKRLTIGTSNKNRFSNLRDIIFEIDPSIIISQSIVQVEESSDTTIGNATLKAHAHYKIHKSNILCVDDGIFLDDKIYSPEVNVRRDSDGKELSKNAIIQKWELILRDKELKGIMEKTFVFIDKYGVMYSDHVNYIIVLRNCEDINYEINPLNNFIYPEGFNKPIAHFTSDELLRFREPQKECLNELIKKLK